MVTLVSARQTSLFDVPGTDADAGERGTRFDAAFGDLRRCALGRGAWIDVDHTWVQGHESLFDAVLDAGDAVEGGWAQWDRVLFDEVVAQPRLSVTWSSTGLPAGLAVVGEMARALSDRYGEPLTRVSANLYRDGRDSVAWHGDTVLRDQPTATVAVVSLGHPRPFRLRPRGGGDSISWNLGHGALAVMGGTCQRTWQHAVPKVAKAGPRICVMFRSAAAVDD